MLEMLNRFNIKPKNKTIYIVAVPEENIGFSVMNRLKKSSGGKKIVL